MNTTEIVHFATSHFIGAYYPLFLTIVGTLTNALTFIVLCRPTFRNTKQRPTLHYVRAMVIFDTLLLYGWNLEHYLITIHGFTFQTYSIALCKIFTFLNYFSTQTAAWLRVFISFDRYLAASRFRRTWFSYSKHVVLMIGFIVVFFFLFNFHILIFTCYYESDGTINRESFLYPLYPAIDIIQSIVYNILPFIIMFVFNTITIYHMSCAENAARTHDRRSYNRAISLALLILTILFPLMTMPGTIVFGYFYFTTSSTLQNLLDSLLYTYHIIEFPIYLGVLTEFRKEVVALLCHCKRTRLVKPAINSIHPA